MTEDNILLITDNDDVANEILSKLVLLRDSDSIAVSDYKLARKILENSGVSIVLVHQKEDTEKTLNFIKSIISDNYSIILLVDEYQQDFILSAYDLGIKDYFSVNSDAYEMLIRTVNCFKFQTLKNKNLRDNSLLKILGAVDSETGFYKYKMCKDLLSEFVKDKQFYNGMFLIIAPDEESKNRYSTDKLSKAIKQTIRGNDIATTVTGGKFYLMLPNIDKLGAYTVIEKIQEILGEKLTIRAGICKIGDKDFNRLEKEAYAALADAYQSGDIAVFLEEKVKTLDSWLSDDEKDEKNYKLFKNAYNNKLEKVIAPVFFRLQKTYEEKLFETKISQYSDELQSVFQLSNPKQESRIKIIYPGFAKIVIYVIHDGLDSPENKEISLNLNEITPKTLSKIIEDFIKEFKATIKK